MEISAEFQRFHNETAIRVFLQPRGKWNAAAAYCTAILSVTLRFKKNASMTIKDREHSGKQLGSCVRSGASGRGPGWLSGPLRVMSLSSAICSHGPSELYSP